MNRKILFITPDYMSHFNPLIPIGREFQSAGYDVVFATGTALSKEVKRYDFQHIQLTLGPESNVGLISSERRREIEKSLSATRESWVSALIEQSETRVENLLWNSKEVAVATLKILECVKPDLIVAVQLTYPATASLLATNTPFATFVTGHPTQLPAEGELYGYPLCVPSILLASESELGALRAHCDAAQKLFTEKFNDLLLDINPLATPVINGLAASSNELVLFNYPAQFMEDRKLLFPHSQFIGASVRDESLDDDLELWLDCVSNKLPTIYFSFGSYFSVHKDILQKIIFALRDEPLRVLFATGVMGVNDFKGFPKHWLVRSYFPQVAVLPFCSVVFCHGGNNTVTEALNAGAALVVAPFASDQFGNAFTVEQHGLGATIDPNRASCEDIRRAVRIALSASCRTAQIGSILRSDRGEKQVRHWCENKLTCMGKAK